MDVTQTIWIEWGPERIWWHLLCMIICMPSQIISLVSKVINFINPMLVFYHFLFILFNWYVLKKWSVPSLMKLHFNFNVQQGIKKQNKTKKQPFLARSEPLDCRSLWRNASIWEHWMTPLCQGAACESWVQVTENRQVTLGLWEFRMSEHCAWGVCF